MVLVDTSSWIHLLRPAGDIAVSRRVRALLESGEACWCPMVRLELWNGAGGGREQRVLQEFSKVLPNLDMDQEVWEAAFGLARSARSAGLSVPAPDLLITACARHHGAELEHSDADFELLSRIG